MSKALALRILFVAAVVIACAFWLRSARAQETHPWVGMARVCASENKGPQACQVMRSRGDFDTQAACEADMPRRLGILADLMHRDHPTWDIEARYVCVPDRAQYNG